MSNPVCAIVGIGPKNGAAFAHRFDEAGYRIALLSRSTDYSGEVASKLSDARSYACDASDPASVDAAFAQVQEQLGDVDVLIYNAGSGSWQTVEEISPEAFEQSWRVNALGALVTSQRVIPAMKKRVLETSSLLVRQLRSEAGPRPPVSLQQRRRKGVLPNRWRSILVHSGSTCRY